MGISLWSDLTWIYLEQGRVHIAEAQLTQEKTDLINTCGTDHVLAELSKDMLSRIYNFQGRWTEAEQLEVEVMDIRKAKLGPDNPDTLTSMANLASTLWNQGR
ncbi:hypothetical protein S40293_09980 [Stachybotrys chartarum IBT 40293]|nr:hypothetical protein S40293_09980 [Stachybotrys chartarum IBT 40293]